VANVLFKRYPINRTIKMAHLIYMCSLSPGQAKQNNWLPSPTTIQPFDLILRLYWPQPQALNGTWSPPPIQCANATG